MADAIHPGTVETAGRHDPWMVSLVAAMVLGVVALAMSWRLV